MGSAETDVLYSEWLLCRMLLLTNLNDRPQDFLAPLSMGALLTLTKMLLRLL